MGSGQGHQSHKRHTHNQTQKLDPLVVPRFELFRNNFGCADVQKHSRGESNQNCRALIAHAVLLDEQNAREDANRGEHRKQTRHTNGFSLGSVSLGEGCC